MTGGSASQGNFANRRCLFYNGDVNKWKKFVYGIKARSFASLHNKSNLFGRFGYQILQSFHQYECR